MVYHKFLDKIQESEYEIIIKIDEKIKVIKLLKKGAFLGSNI
jgi:hypothetical protein